MGKSKIKSYYYTDQNTLLTIADSLIFENFEEENLEDQNIEISNKYHDEFLKISFDYSVTHKDISEENRINIERESFLREHLTKQFIETILEESFEFGIKSRSEKIIEEQLNINALATRNWLNEIFIDYFNDEKIIIGILRIIGRFDESVIFPQGQTMALAALNHKSAEIQELGIRAFENWGSYNSLKILENIKINVGWLNEYKDQVIEDLKEELHVSY
ncbi:MAG: hypothetical protein ACTSX4_06505 [Candidatus Helarchaeota archaeon]